jgi:hypothetical protein
MIDPEIVVVLIKFCLDGGKVSLFGHD